MQVIKTKPEIIAAVLNLKNQKKSIGFVPTMGALHAGHVSLIRHAKTCCDIVIVSIFVNPTQFGPAEDLDQYPRPIARDIEILQTEQCDILFLPDNETLYPDGTQHTTKVHVPMLGDHWCGASRPGHFDGVSSVVTRFFQLIRPDYSFFGEKDFQQLKIIKKMTQDLFFETKIVHCPVYREPDGLAMSSRNQYLSNSERLQAPKLYKTLQFIQKKFHAGETNPSLLVHQGENFLLDNSDFIINYIAIVDSQSLESTSTAKPTDRVLISATLGKTRLIDNIPL